ncbi:MAG: ATP-binding protein [Spirochaetia bacterium]|jgi:two-component system NtrC family sensor kinase|nr:ATP-binding protein [Spirochaetia bacterium]
MEDQIVKIQLLYEIAMSIGNSLDLKVMLKQSLTVFLNKLNCSAGGVLFYRQSQSGYKLNDTFVIPRSFYLNSKYKEIERKMQKVMGMDEKKERLASLPVSETNHDFNLLIMELPGIGFIFFIKNNTSFHDNLVKSLMDPVSRLAGACTACYQNEELIQARDRLEFRVKERTQQLEESNESLKSAYSDLKNAQKQLVQNEKMVSIGYLAAGVAHEINNPTGFITSNLYTMTEYMNAYKKLFDQMDKLTTEINLNNFESVLPLINNILAIKEEEDYPFILNDAFQLLEESIDGARRIKVIVQGLRDFARPKNTQYKIANFNHAVNAALKLTVNELKYKCEVEKKLGEIPDISCRLDQLTQVFVNLLVNAGQAIKDYGKIIVETCLEGDNIKAEICDDGIGIEKETIGKLFDPFFSTKPVGEGTGLGLFISHGIIEDHGGAISVKSTIGKGTCFTIILPLKRDTI